MAEFHFVEEEHLDVGIRKHFLALFAPKSFLKGARLRGALIRDKRLDTELMRMAKTHPICYSC